MGYSFWVAVTSGPSQLRVPGARAVKGRGSNHGGVGRGVISHHGWGGIPHVPGCPVHESNVSCCLCILSKPPVLWSHKYIRGFQILWGMLGKNSSLL